MDLSDQELLRYSRQVLLPEIDVEGQERLKSARVAVVGMGGLGCPAAQYLVAAGVGMLTLVDMDTVDISNLQRQILYTETDVGRRKVEVAKERLNQLNPHVEIKTIRQAFDEELADALLPDVDLLLDCTDNFKVRGLINAACLKHERPLISAAAVAWQGQLTVLDFRQPDTPCMNCLFGELEDTRSACVESGIAGPVVGMMGLMQAVETVKFIVGAGDASSGRFRKFDALSGKWNEFAMSVDPDCRFCQS